MYSFIGTVSWLYQQFNTWLISGRTLWLFEDKLSKINILIVYSKIQRKDSLCKVDVVVILSFLFSSNLKPLLAPQNILDSLFSKSNW